VSRGNTEPNNDWRQFADDVSACVYNVACALLPDPEALKGVRKQMLQAEARILRGLLAVVEGQLAQTGPADSPRPEKIPIQ